ncbi:MAG: hypothetical protein Q7K35_03010 [bacterium]|nr:hypothetical protein [bacterium]
MIEINNLFNNMEQPESIKKGLEMGPPVENIQRINKGEKHFQIFADVNGERRWVLSSINGVVTIKGDLWSKKMKRKVEEFTGEKFENPNMDWA